MNVFTHGSLGRAVPIAVCCVLASSAAASVDGARDAFTEWVRVKSQIAEEKSDWMREKALLADTLETAQAESEALEKGIAELESSSTEADTKRAELKADIDEAKATSEALVKVVSEAEAKIRALLPIIPTSLAAELQPLLTRLPKDGEKTKVPVSQRLQTIAALLAQIEKFGSSLAMMSEVRTLPGGEAREVQTLYFGFGAAFFSDPSGTIAGYGAPGPNGWEWKTAEGDVAARISRAIAIHESNQPPAFVSLPVEIN